MEILTKVHNKNLVKWAKDKPKVVVLSADLTSSTEINMFRDAYPDRFFSMGMAEQNMVSFAGGLAREGFYPFIHTFAVFIYRQAYNQIVSSIAYSNLPVRFFGFLPGITTPGGITHQAIEDIAIMRAIPNMTILEPGDATEVETVLDVVHQIEGPVYVRMLRGEIPRLFPRNEPMKLGIPRVLSTGTDITLFSSGICTEEAMRATTALIKHGVSIQHMHISTHKPFNDRSIIDAISKAKHGVITMENHTIIGGLGTEIAEVIAEEGLGKKLVRIGLKDVFAHGASRHYLMKKYELDSLSLIKHIENLIGKGLEISEEELAEVRLEPIHSKAKPEAL